MFKTIVVGVDGREGGRDALSLAGRLALLAGGDLVAVRVLPFDYYVSHAGAPPFASMAEPDAKREVEDELAKAGLTARIRVMGDSSPARALHRVAEEERADVIAVGSTHHGRIGRVFAGDDAAATLHGSSCPVAVAPRGLAAREWKAVQKIGVGFDGGPEARQAAALAVALASECGASIRAQSVVGTPIPYAAGMSTYHGDWLERAQQAASDDMGELLADMDIEAAGDIVVGMAVGELTKLSEEVDLLVVGSRAWGPVRRIVVGSTAASLIREAHCPVLVLPRGAATGQPGEAEPHPTEREAPATV
jgi:nucleotide-binding universal stress UspA family protein